MSAYSEEIQQQEDFDILNMDYIWDRVQVANGKDIAEWDIINDQENVERLTLACMRKHFGQAQGTPLTSDYWIKTLCDKQCQDDIISGTFDLSPYPRSLQLYFGAMRNTDTRKEIAFEYSFPQFCNLMQNPTKRHPPRLLVATMATTRSC